MPIFRTVGVDFVDGTCDDDVLPNQAGICEKHFKEYLVQLLNVNKIDPISIFDLEQCKAELRRHSIAVPADMQDKIQYKNTLIEIIKKQVPLY